MPPIFAEHRGSMREDVLNPLFPPGVTRALDRIALISFAGGVAGSMLSIVLSEALLGVAILAGAYILRQDPGLRRGWSRFAWPLGAFLAWTIVTAFVSADVAGNLQIVRKFYWFTIPLTAVVVCRAPGSVLWIYRVIFAAAVLASVMGVGQFASNPSRDLLHRISGFMGHWMTYSGALAVVVVALAACGACLGIRKRPWLWAVGFLLLVPLYLSETRSAWLGAVAGLVVVLLLVRPRSIILLALSLAVILLVSPDRFRDRLRSGWNPDDPNTANRIELAETSARLIRANPWFGVGPKSVGAEALKYRGNRHYPDWMYQHMHNNLLQIAAERGIPGLLLWLWLIGRLAWDAWRAYLGGRGSWRRAAEPDTERLAAATASLGSIAALLVSGLFEYNFGDSEVLALFLFVVSAPYARAGTGASFRNLGASSQPGGIPAA